VYVGIAEGNWKGLIWRAMVGSRTRYFHIKYVGRQVFVIVFCDGVEMGREGRL
jgi:hypothetical protein